MSSGDGYRVAVAGATGAVGTLMLEVLRRSSLPVSEVVPFATERSEGRELELADANVNVDMIIQNEPVGDTQAELSFTVPKDDLRTARTTLEPLLSELGVGGMDADETMGKVSIVGAGMKSHPGVAARVFQTLGEHDINIEMISTSPIKISCVIDGEKVPHAVRSLHSAFELAGPDTIRPEQPFGQFAR